MLQLWHFLGLVIICIIRIIVGVSKKAQIKVECRHPKLDYDYTLEEPNKLES